MRPPSLAPAALVAAAVGLFVPSSAQAQGLVLRLPGLGATAFTFTNTTLVRYRHHNFDANRHDDEFFSLTERLDMAMQAPPWRLYARLDGVVPWNHSTVCEDPPAGTEGSECVRGNFRPERLQLSYRRGDITLELGDFYQVFGRGVSLAFRKVDPIGLDTTMHGLRTEWDHGRVTLRAFGGLANPQNLDPITLSVFSDPFDILGGASASVRVGADDDVEVSVHGVHVDFEDFPGALLRARAMGDTTRTDAFSFARFADTDTRTSYARVTVGGARVEVPALMDGDLSLYAEGNFLRRDTTLTSGDREFFGRGIYANAQLIRGRWTFLAEWKDYTHYLVAPTESNNILALDLARLYSSAPSLERDDQRPRTNANARGGRVRVDYALTPSPWIFTLNTLLYGWSESFDEVSGDQIDPWDPDHAVLTTHSYFAVRRRSRPAPAPAAPQAPDAGGSQTPNAGATASAGGAAIGTSGVGGASATRVSSGDYALTASIGYRRELHLGEVRGAGGAVLHTAGQIEHESVQFDVDWAFPVGANDSLELRIDNRYERNWQFDHAVGGMRGGIALTWAHGLPLVVSAMLRWDDTTRDVGQPGIFRHPFGVVNQDARLAPTLFPAGEVRWNFSLTNFVRLFAGMTPGGRVCSGGVCRDVPLFQGAIAELVLRI